MRSTVLLLTLLLFSCTSNEVSHGAALAYYVGIVNNSVEISDEQDSILSNMIVVQDRNIMNGTIEVDTTAASLLSAELAKMLLEMDGKLAGLKSLKPIQNDFGLRNDAIAVVTDMRTLHEHSYLRIIKQLRGPRNVHDSEDVRLMKKILPKLIQEEHSLGTNMSQFKLKYQLSDGEIGKLTSH